MARCSVIIPAYNVEEYVAQAIQSALEQTYPDVEVIVVNDGSTDGTAEAIRPFLGSIKYVEQPNRGLPGARNSALEVATGEYIALLDADDYWRPTRLQTIVPFLEEHPEFGFAFVRIRLRKYLPRSRGFRWNNQAYWITQYNFVPYMTVIRRELFDRHGTFDENLHSCEDWDMWLRFITGGERVGALLHSGQRLSYHRRRPGSLSYDWIEALGHQLKVLEKALASEGTRNIPGLAARVEVQKGKIALSEGDPRSARAHFRRALSLGGLPSSTRLQAIAFAIAPSRSWDLYKSMVARRRRIKLPPPEAPALESTGTDQKAL